MSRFSEDDSKLTEFLKRHQPVVPAANPDLEDQLMSAIASTPQPRPALISTSQVQRRIFLGSSVCDRGGVSGNGRQPSHLRSSLPA